MYQLCTFYEKFNYNKILFVKNYGKNVVTRIFQVYLFLFLSLLQLDLFASDIRIKNEITSLSLLENASVYVDKNSSESITDVMSHDTFTPVGRESISYGYLPNATVWIRFTLQNDTNSTIKTNLVYENENTDIANLYMLQDGQIVVTKNGVYNREKFEQRLYFTYKIELLPKEKKTYYLELKSQTHSINFSLFLEDEKHYYEREFSYQMFIAIFFAACVIIITFNFAVYLLSRERLNIYYVIVLISLFLYFLSYSGMIYYFLPDNLTIIKMQSNLATAYIYFLLLFLLLFVNEFLSIAKHKVLDLLFRFSMFFVSVIFLLDSFFNVTELMTYLIFAGGVSLLFLGVYLVIVDRTFNSKYFLVLWSVPIVGFLELALFDLGYLEHYHLHIFGFSMLIEKMFFSKILISQVYNYKNEKIQALTDLIATKQTLFEKEQLISEQSKLTIMGEMIQNIAHQWRQPLAEINAMLMKIDADIFTKKLTTEILEEDIQKVESIVLHMSDTIENYNNFFKPDKLKEETTFTECVQAALRLVDFSINSKNITVITNIKDDAKLTLYKGELVQVILVILNNAIDILAKKEGERVVKIMAQKAQKEHVLSIEDNGGGVKQDSIEKIFEAYFSEKDNGTGIGLFMSKNIIEISLGGKLEVVNTIHGAKFTITL